MQTMQYTTDAVSDTADNGFHLGQWGMGVSSRVRIHGQPGKPDVFLKRGWL